MYIRSNVSLCMCLHMQGCFPVKVFPQVRFRAHMFPHRCVSRDLCFPPTDVFPGTCIPRPVYTSVRRIRRIYPPVKCTKVPRSAVIQKNCLHHWMVDNKIKKNVDVSHYTICMWKIHYKILLLRKTSLRMSKLNPPKPEVSFE